MLPAVATPAVAESSSKPQATSQHQYGTRIRSNSVIRPSIRLRQSPDLPPPRRIKPVPVAKAKAAIPPSEPEPVEMPVFPPPHVMLHSEDASSKVLLAIGRSFVSVDNKAMTIKDLAEMTIKFGLMCQNVSAAGQAITTYIRNHLQRCDAQQDHPLLLRHVLSGTPSDDDLVHALHSRVGGAHCVLGPSDTRITNFRRGTMVWYLSRAAGVPCPFARAGIRLCEYGENGKIGTVVNQGKERKRERDRLRRAEQCGQKRKRLLRACADKGSDSDSSAEEEEPQCKKPLTLRLPPTRLSVGGTSSSIVHSPSSSSSLRSGSASSSDSDSDSMSVDSSSSEEEEEEEPEQSVEPPWCLPPYPRRSISIPSYTPTIDGSHTAFPPPLSPSYETAGRPWRSPSVPFSATSASPPPDTEYEDDDFASGSAYERSTPARLSRTSSDDFFAELGAETDWGDSPGPVSPPAQFEDEDVYVKQEPRDVRGLLDAWEDLDSSVAELKVIDVVAQAAAADLEQTLPKPKVEPFEDFWPDFSEEGIDFLDSPGDEMIEFIKQEEEDIMLPERATASPSMSPMSPMSPYFPSLATSYLRDSLGDIYQPERRGSELMWKDAELFSPDSFTPHDFDTELWLGGGKREQKSPLVEPTRSFPLPASPEPVSSPSAVQPPIQPPEEPRTHIATGSISKREDIVMHHPAYTNPTQQVVLGQCTLDTRLDISQSVDYLDQPMSSDKDEAVVVHTHEPCVPAICATELEGVAVYQMVLGSCCVLRRIDTDFVNITPVVEFFGLNNPELSALPSAVAVNRGSSLVCGTWVPLSTARDLVHDQSLMNAFLSYDLQERFSDSLQAFYRPDPHSRLTKQFGPHFQSTVDSKRESLSSFRLELRPWGKVPRSDVEDHLLSVHPPFALRAAPFAASPSSEDLHPETPLSPTEEEIFHTLCAASDWDSPSPPTSTSVIPPCVDEPELVVVVEPPAAIEPPTAIEPSACQERPLRRSKRVACATANRPHTRSSKRATRIALS